MGPSCGSNFAQVAAWDMQRRCVRPQQYPPTRVGVEAVNSCLNSYCNSSSVIACEDKSKKTHLG